MENNQLIYNSIAGDIEYQANSIVSKQLLKKQNGNVTLFAFDKNESLTEHTSPFDALVMVIDGKLEIKLAGVPHLVSTGEYMVMPADIAHGLVAVEQTKMVLIMIKG